MELVFRFIKFISYQWRAKTKYYIHSPFVYQFYLNILEGETNHHFKAINKLRTNLKSRPAIMQVTDLGTGQKKEIKISATEKNVSVAEKYGAILYRLAAHFKPATVLELGTSIGLSSSYLALGAPGAKVISLEGSPEIAAFAAKTHAELGINNVEIIKGEFDITLRQIIKQIPSADLVYFDGNHRKEATLSYFKTCLTKATEDSVFVFDDIYWSREMNEAWEEIKQHPQITLTIDIYQFGICFFKHEKLAKEHFVLRY